MANSSGCNWRFGAGGASEYLLRTQAACGKCVGSFQPPAKDAGRSGDGNATHAFFSDLSAATGGWFASRYSWANVTNEADAQAAPRTDELLLTLDHADAMRRVDARYGGRPDDAVVGRWKAGALPHAAGVIYKNSS